MEYLVFNDASLPFEAIEDVNTHFPDFLKIVDIAFKNRMKAIRFTENIDSGWFELNVTNDITLREWLKDKPKDFRIKVKSFIQKTKSSLIPESLPELIDKFDLSAFYLGNDTECKTVSLGACYYQNQLSVSCNSYDKWNSSIFKINIKELTELGDRIYSADVRNCTSHNHWDEHFTIIDSERKENLQKGNKLWEDRKNQFPNLEFVGDTPKQLLKLEISNILFSQLWNALTKLNQYVEKKDKTYTLEELKAFSGLNISNEKETVRTNPKFSKSRTFDIANKKEFFGFHIKNFSGNLRLHFKLKESKIYIGYFGKHLPTKSDPK